MRRLLISIALLVLVVPALAQQRSDLSGMLSDLPDPHNYVLKRVSSYDRTGGNADFRPIPSGQSITIFDEVGPGVITHIWFTIADRERYHLKKLVLRIYWDGEDSPSVETPIGDFFGQGLGEYHLFQSLPIQVSSEKALNCFFPMPFQRSAKITVSNEGKEAVSNFYYNIDYRGYAHPLSASILYFHAQYRQCAPCQGWTNQWKSNGDEAVNDKKNLDGEGNYVWMEANGRGHFVGVTMSVVQNQDGWWGEGDDMFFVDGEKLPSINGTGSEDYFLGAWDFGNTPFAYLLYGAPVKGEELAGSRSSIYRFHLDSPITFTKSLRATIEHGHANARSDNYYSVAYWYQTEPHTPFPPLPPVEDRLPRVYPVGGPGNAGK
jgi:D-arabinan exo alpha-(1,3)/(1,5)-arabinofuranosidase (non-reducing end)